jgi:hypothetical protein
VKKYQRSQERCNSSSKLLLPCFYNSVDPSPKLSTRSFTTTTPPLLLLLHLLLLLPLPLQTKNPKIDKPYQWLHSYTNSKIHQKTKQRNKSKKNKKKSREQKKAKKNTSRKRNLTTIWICKEVLGATILSIRSPNSHPDPSPPPLLHLLFLLLFVQLHLLLLLLPLHRNTILHLRNPVNCYYYFFLRYKFKNSPKKSKK